ncbi:carboxypeptidase-like regulatory domain-containing protein [Corallococcus sicarius]|uniref:Carboxypeptidase regulatory-like domain-containing protein n=1 Tax=Corallococcus sicarius TaxID=2316726 RepID=A0A3A8MIL0_9BACT|nr:carboxypeptidase-like regulatory domain-containing protein [Corallococcus sicarius]RKH32288.1 carboxypeptidase regulatory-like domain-containing protein [Corallococcus sicarius]
MSGKVVDARGQPMQGVVVVADNTMIYDTNALGTTGSDGTYRIDVSSPAGTWHASATHKVQYNSRSYTFDLDPNDDAVFAGNEGAVRNFTWKLSGKRPDLGFYGGFVAVYVDQLLDPADPEQPITSDDIELTLTPNGKLVDGSDGAPITKKLVRTPDGDAVEDVPVGRYTVTARYAQAGKAVRPMQVRIKDTGDYANSVTADFEVLVTTRHQILLNAQLPTP